MSIIYNALKKSEENQPDNNSTDSQIEGPTPPSNPVKPTKPNKSLDKNLVVRIIATILFIGCLTFFVLTITQQGKTKSSKTKVSFDIVSIFKGKKSTNKENSYQFKASKYQLNGILASDTKNIAMINGDSYAENDKINDLIIKKIESTKVIFIAPTNEEFFIELD